MATFSKVTSRQTWSPIAGWAKSSNRDLEGIHIRSSNVQIIFGKSHASPTKDLFNFLRSPALPLPSMLRALLTYLAVLQTHNRISSTSENLPHLSNEESRKAAV